VARILGRQETPLTTRGMGLGPASDPLLVMAKDFGFAGWSAGVAEDEDRGFENGVFGYPVVTAMIRAFKPALWMKYGV
jgi:hypothetical protein